jgi:hypothetical protein
MIQVGINLECSIVQPSILLLYIICYGYTVLMEGIKA